MAGTLDILQIQKLLPHRYPFLLVDKVVACEPGASLTALKNVTFNEPFFQGHFPSQPIMPGVLIMEALAQATALLTSQSDDKLGEGAVYYLAGIDNARFKRQVVPGDQLRLQVTYLKHKRHLWSFDCRAEVDGELAASAQIMCAVSVA
ncbi:MULTISPECIES: 3-hydroxyacyl-ACP dehydratase FabZ [Methylomonas]|uniref:3-hydroxyacyl-[acyl-carrier-protein] dehydratase FabZ n=1 Tax=Methylomonas koyamae TaxID=702114 RepID=A0AA91D979_9GAMM|nr:MULTISPECIES: 3-hydroxyacyl-ACP dehydratase FabZ [Methylomonas]ANE56360.1 3-hydroxyacyl-[acyl-carrier-protein] dehydratase FabZ [Methylomonas sp. DH-1]OAI21692.1 beta-hydroxyacyl-ACP dehydratase [Methylomonas koyamae]BBL57715.1 3-hydroxyacyl-[acyl-carrier-protein] dehydratase FabZ [Methylomonas koyamae]